MVRKDLTIYYVLIFAAIFFTICDLVALSFQWLVPTLIFSSFTMIITFIGSHKTKALDIEKGVDDTIDFIRGNFNCANIILSILDVMCCILALFTGIFIIAVISRSALALRLLIIINKYRLVTFGIIVFVFTYILKRRKNNNMENELKVEKTKKVSFWKKVWNGIKACGQWIYANKKSIIGTIFGVISGIATAIVTNADLIMTLPKLVLWDINFTALIVGILVFVGVEVGVVGKGFETIKAFFARIKVKKEEKALISEQKATIKAEAKVQKAENKKMAKAKALVEKLKKQTAIKTKKEAEKKEIEELAQKIMNEDNK